MQREQFRRDQPAQIRAALDVVGLGDAAIQRFAAQRARVLLEAADQSRQFAELAVARELPPEFEPLARRKPSTLAELEAEIVTVLRDAIDLLAKLRLSASIRRSSLWSAWPICSIIWRAF